ncbi:hypothetical protein OAL62_00695 [bacterium]|nr:hypothetical protein [Akkermansiaceae bacterium]MDB4302480.1 hypothetical protein [bacterium]MDB4804324.1 hypothetical protein [Akkermansiaceae bacterium]MDC0314893.1 hypothetical protein [bacterium]
MFSFLRKSVTVVAAKNITEYTVELISAVLPFEDALALSIEFDDENGAYKAISDAASNTNIRRLISRLQFSLICGIPLERIGSELMEPLLSKYSPPRISGTILKKIFSEVLSKEKDNKPMADFEETWPEIRSKVLGRFLENEAEAQPSDDRFLNFYQ